MDFPYNETLYQQQKQLIIIMVKMWCAKSKQRLYTAASPHFIVNLVPYFLLAHDESGRGSGRCGVVLQWYERETLKIIIIKLAAPEQTECTYIRT